MDIENSEMIKYAERVYYSYCVRVQAKEKRRTRVLGVVQGWLKVLLEKRK